MKMTAYEKRMFSHDEPSDLSPYERIDLVRKIKEKEIGMDHLKNPYGKAALARICGFVVHSYDKMVNKGTICQNYYEVLFHLSIALDVSLNYILDQEVTNMEFVGGERITISVMGKLDRQPRETLMRVWRYFGYDAVRAVLDG